MDEIEILKRIQENHSNVFEGTYPFPLPFIGNKGIKAILLGTDPGNSKNCNTKHFVKVFGLENLNSQYFSKIASNINMLTNLTVENLYVQNVCKNYFNCDTYDNPHWIEIAKKYWLPLIKKELDYLFNSQIPILLSTEIILKLVITGKPIPPAKDLYQNLTFICENDNYFERKLIPFYRHQDYSLLKWTEYKSTLNDFFK